MLSLDLVSNWTFMVALGRDVASQLLRGYKKLAKDDASYSEVSSWYKAPHQKKEETKGPRDWSGCLDGGRKPSFQHQPGVDPQRASGDLPPLGLFDTNNPS